MGSKYARLGKLSFLKCLTVDNCKGGHGMNGSNVLDVHMHLPKEW